MATAITLQSVLSKVEYTNRSIFLLQVFIVVFHYVTVKSHAHRIPSCSTPTCLQHRSLLPLPDDVEESSVDMIRQVTGLQRSALFLESQLGALPCNA